MLLFSRADAVLNCDFKTLSVHPRAVLKPNLSLIHANFAHDLALHARLSPLPLHQVRAGHRIKLTIDDVTFEASNVRVSNDVVAVQILDAVVRGGWTVPSKYGINFDKTAHHWILAHTSGTVLSYEYQVGTSKRKQSSDSKKIAWMADTRPWRVVLRTEDQGRMVEGNPNLLREAVEQGASIRINLGVSVVCVSGSLGPFGSSFFASFNCIFF